MANVFISITKTRKISEVIKHKGVSLIEILISLFVFSIALLALAKAQVLTLSYDNEAYLNSLAAIRLQSMCERLYASHRLSPQDIKRWNKLNQELLPQGRGEVRGRNPYVVTLYWNDGKKPKKESSTILLLK